MLLAPNTASEFIVANNDEAAALIIKLYDTVRELLNYN